MKKYGGNVTKYEGKMKKYEGICRKFEEISPKASLERESPFSRSQSLYRGGELGIFQVPELMWRGTGRESSGFSKS